MTRLAFDNATLDITSDGDVYSVQMNGQAYAAQLIDASHGRLDLSLDGRRLAAYVTPDGQNRWVTVNSRTYLLRRASAPRAAAAQDSSSALSAPMPGQVRAVNVNPGDPVKKGQVLIVLEAMKMEIRLQAPFDGLALSVDAGVGQTVEREQILVRLNRI